MTKEKPYPEYLPFLANWGIKLSTGYLIAKITECHKTGNVSLLQDILEDQVDQKYYVSNKMMNTLIKHKKRHIKKGNGFGFSLADRNGITNTLLSRYRNDGSEILIDDSLAKNISLEPSVKSNFRKLTVVEAERLQGFPDGYTEGVSDTQRYKTLGNAVTVNVVTALINKMFKGSEYDRSR